MRMNRVLNCVEATDDEISKALVTLAVESTLIKMGKPVLDEVTKQLVTKYKCYIPDCYKHPEYLKNVLQGLYGPSHLVMVESIEKYLDEFKVRKSVMQFLEVIRE